MSEKERTVSRREFLKIAGVAGATIGVGAGMGGLLAACGGDEETTTTTTAAPGTTTTAAPGTTTTTAAGVEMGREIKIGFVTPLTGALSLFGVPDKYCVDRAVEAIGDGVIAGDGLKHPVQILTRDSQSDGGRAAQVAGDLIQNDGVDIMTAASTPDTVNPVADQAEALGTPCITNDCPWQPYVAGRAAGDFSATFKWTYHTFWGLEDVQACFLDMWSQVETNKVVAAMYPNDADGIPWQAGWAPVWEPNGFTTIDPGLYQNFTEDFTSQISQFKGAGAEIGMGVFLPPDFTNFWKQAAQQGWTPKVGSYAKALLFPGALEALGPVGNGLTTEVWWTPAHPFTSALLGETAQQFADEYTARGNGQWTQPLLHFIVFEMAVDTLQRTTSVDDKEAMVAAITSTKLETIGGLIDFTAPVEPAGPPWTAGPRHVHPNVYKTPLVGGQWRTGTQYPFELTICSNAAGAMIPVQDKVQPLV
jgi:branched-chain amino acid transport system substrate-binding protein